VLTQLVAALNGDFASDFDQEAEAQLINHSRGMFEVQIVLLLHNGDLGLHTWS